MILLLSVEGGELYRRPFGEWTLAQAVQILNESPWSSQKTFTRVISGVGSGVRGEKEILNTFYTRILSARPIRQALARVEQINHGYDEMDANQQGELDRLLAPGLDLPIRDWIVIAVSFRSNDPEQENNVHRFLRTNTSDSLQNSAFLSTTSFPRLRLAAYFPPRGDGVGARFVFPRRLNGENVVKPSDQSVTFELEVPAAAPILAVRFPVARMMFDGELVL